MRALNNIGIPIVLVLVSFNQEAMSQSFSSDALYVEALGQGVLYSVNYDHRFAEHVGVRFGATYFTWSESGQEAARRYGPGGTKRSAAAGLVGVSHEDAVHGGGSGIDGEGIGSASRGSKRIGRQDAV